MHELSVCLALLDQVQSIAREHAATGVERILLQVGPLSGIEPPLLKNAYPLAAAGTVAEGMRNSQSAITRSRSSTFSGTSSRR